ncbi:MAG: phosphoribosylanthranilate isomerase [Gammaproteobacteria bacterium]|nr:MAG: phosphoribosylanthranilate isomerase [Gammaproteobacteria bacterium]
MQRTLIKICGLTRAEDAQNAVDAGADALGLVFYPLSPRAVTVAQAEQILAAVPPFVSVVALFVNPSAEEVNEVLAGLPIDVLQFHGSEPVEFCRQFQRPWLKSVAMREGVRLDEIGANYAGARGLLLDAWQEEMPGGTGTAFDWQANWGECPQHRILAGGLNPENVADAMNTLRPDAVDVSSGVETSPGLKDAVLMRAFVQAVRAVDVARSGG